MSNIRAPFRFFVLLTFLLTVSAAAHAQATRTRVSGACAHASTLEAGIDGASVRRVSKTRVSGHAGSGASALAGVRPHDSGRR